jgi:hypothetical protein
MSKVVKGIGRAVKGIFKGITKTFKAVTSSSLGKALLIGATIYLGGAAMGYWNSPFQSINGAFLSPAAAEAGVATATQAAEAGTTLAGTEAAGGVGAGVGSDLSYFSEGGGLIKSSLPSAAAPGVGAGVVEAAKHGFFAGDLAKYGLIQAGAGALQGAFSPNALDTAERQAELERENLAWRNEFLSPNFAVGQFSLGMQPSGQALTDSSGRPIYPTPPTTPGVQPVQPVKPVGLIAQAMGR